MLALAALIALITLITICIALYHWRKPKKGAAAKMPGKGKPPAKPPKIPARAKRKAAPQVKGADVFEDIKDEFLKKFKEKTEALVVGDPLNSKTQMGCQVSKEQYQRVLNYIKIGKEEGAKVITGGNPVGEKGFFIEPTIFEGTDNMTIAKDEIFGGVVTVLTFKDTDDVITRANNTPYGLSAGIWTNDVRKAHKVAREIKAGTIWVNCYNVFDACSPFGGFKQSGIGRELGKYAIDLYTEEKSIWFNLD